MNIGRGLLRIDANRPPGSGGEVLGDHRTAPNRLPNRLSSIDTSFLRSETWRAPRHFGALIIADDAGLRDGEGRIRVDAIRRRIERRLLQMPHFAHRVSDIPLGLGRPIWVDDEHFDIQRHVRMAALPSPGGRAELLDMTAMLHEELLDRRHPLWELWLVDGLSDGSVGIVMKIHHCLADGMAGLIAAISVFDAADPTGELDHREKPAPASTPEPSAMTRITVSLVQQILDPLFLLCRFIRSLVSKHDRRLTLSTLRDMISGLDTWPSTTARGGPLGTSLGSRRVLRSAAIPLSAVDAARSGTEATVNDVILAGVTGGLRNWLLESGGEPVDQLVLIPVATRGAGPNSSSGNHVGALFVTLPVTEADPHRRLDLIAHRTRRAKAAHQADIVAMGLSAFDHLPALLVNAGAHLMSKQPFASLLITNVKGPPQELSLLGGRVREVIPIVPVAQGMSLGIAALSYAGTISIALLADPQTCKHLDRLTDAVQREISALIEPPRAGRSPDNTPLQAEPCE